MGGSDSPYPRPPPPLLRRSQGPGRGRGLASAPPCGEGRGGHQLSRGRRGPGAACANPAPEAPSAPAEREGSGEDGGQTKEGFLMARSCHRRPRSPTWWAKVLSGTAELRGGREAGADRVTGRWRARGAGSSSAEACPHPALSSARPTPTPPHSRGRHVLAIARDQGPGPTCLGPQGPTISSKVHRAAATQHWLCPGQPTLDPHCSLPASSRPDEAHQGQRPCRGHSARAFTPSQRGARPGAASRVRVPSSCCQPQRPPRLSSPTGATSRLPTIPEP